MIHPRAWSVRSRLLVGQVLLLAVVCVGISAATEFELRHYLIGRLDTQLIEVGHRASEPPLGRADHRLPPGPPPDFITGPGPEFLGAPGQPIGTLGAIVTDGVVTDSGVVVSQDSRAALPNSVNSWLDDLPVDGKVVAAEVGDLGHYRLIAVRNTQGSTVVVGMSTKEVDDTLMRVLLIFVVVTVIALLVAATLGILIIRRALTPLDRVAATAGRVADLKLDRGEVELPVRVPVDDADPRTEVGQLGAALNRMLDHIAGALSARQASETRVRQFLADASHELRTPLTAIRGYTELAQRRRAEIPDEVANAMGRVESEAARMTHLVEDMLLLARLDSGRPLEQEVVDLSQLTVDAISDAHIAGREHQWNLDLPDAPVTVCGDVARLHQVLANLLANARTHTPPGTTVTVALVATTDDGAVWRITDDGPGIPKQLQPEVFERFARGDSSRSRRAGSTGLGLAIVAAVVKAHGGTITLDSVPGHTEFTVTLPGAHSESPVFPQ